MLVRKDQIPCKIPLRGMLLGSVAVRGPSGKADDDAGRGFRTASKPLLPLFTDAIISEEALFLKCFGIQQIVPGLPQGGVFFLQRLKLILFLERLVSVYGFILQLVAAARHIDLVGKHLAQERVE